MRDWGTIELPHLKNDYKEGKNILAIVTCGIPPNQLGIENLASFPGHSHLHFGSLEVSELQVGMAWEKSCES